MRTAQRADSHASLGEKFQRYLVTKHRNVNREELKIKLDAIGIPGTGYSLDGTLKPMRTVLYFENSKWLTFEFDERGRVLDKNFGLNGRGSPSLKYHEENDNISGPEQ